MNENAVDILASYNLTAQVSLDGKTYFVTQADAANFGENNNKALSYYDGMFIYCAENRTYYVWNERKAGEERSQLLENDFTYPANIVTNGIVYSGKIYNFFKFLHNSPALKKLNSNYYNCYNQKNMDPATKSCRGDES